MDYWNIYKDVWNFHKKYSVVNDSAEYWNAVNDEGEQIVKKYNHSDFVVALIVDVITELSRVCKEVKQDADRTV